MSFLRDLGRTMFSTRDERENMAAHRVAIIDQIYSKLFFIYVPPVFSFLFLFMLESEQTENADIESSFALLLPVGYTRSICHSVLKHEIQSCNVVGKVSSLHCVDPRLGSKKRVYSAGSGRLK